MVFTSVILAGLSNLLTPLTSAAQTGQSPFSNVGPFRHGGNRSGIAPGVQFPAGEDRVRLEEAFPGRVGAPVQGYFHDELITYQIIDGVKVFQGDIIIDDREISETPSYGIN